MLRRILVLAMMASASCHTLDLSPTPYENTVTATGTAETIWLTTEMNGVRLSMRVPEGWTAVDVEHGLLLSEPPSSNDSGDVEVTVLLNVFVPVLDNFDLPQDEAENRAFALLEQVVNMPSMVGQDVVVNEPVSFMWGEHAAAYYLLTNQDGAKTIVIAVEVSSAGNLVVCNLSVPASEDGRVREMLPEVLDGLRINGVQMDSTALEVLPDPLNFPYYHSSPNPTSTVVQ